MKRTIALLLALLMCFALVSCGKSEKKRSDQVELTVFAASSLTETLSRLAEEYERTHPDVRLTIAFDSSGTLMTQIREGAECDLFFSAAQKQMDELEEEGYLSSGTRRDMLENRVILAVPEGSGAVESFTDMARKLEDGSILLAIGNEDVPVGQYTRRILESLSLDEEKLASAGHITYGSSVKEVTTQVAQASVDCGIIYGTDAFSAGLSVVDQADEEMCGAVVYPAAVLESSLHREEAQDFLQYLTTEEAGAVFEAVGFLPVLRTQ